MWIPPVHSCTEFERNLADGLTKPLPGVTLHQLYNPFLYMLGDLKSFAEKEDVAVLNKYNDKVKS